MNVHTTGNAKANTTNNTNTAWCFYSSSLLDTVLAGPYNIKVGTSQSRGRLKAEDYRHRFNFQSNVCRKTTSTEGHLSFRDQFGYFWRQPVRTFFTVFHLSRITYCSVFCFCFSLGPFVMNTHEEITQAINDYRMGKNGFENAHKWKSYVYRQQNPELRRCIIQIIQNSISVTPWLLPQLQCFKASAKLCLSVHGNGQIYSVCASTSRICSDC